jgi:septal ring factor EnvC (AmiA/AmiB activator)
VKPLLTYAVLLLCLGGISQQAAGQSEIKKRQVELQNIREQIRTLEEKISKQQKNEQASLDLLDTYDRKATLVRRLISRLRVEEQALQRQIDTTRRTIGLLEGQFRFLKDHYAKYVASVYRAGRVHDLELLLSSNSLNQLYIRNEYLKRFSAQRKKDAETLVNKKNEIEDIQAELQQQLTEQRRLIAEKGAEEDRLASLAADRRRILGEIRKDKKTLQRSIDRQMKAAQALEGMIAELIEADRIRKEREAEEQRTSRLPQPPPVKGEFASKKGKLRWPVSEGSVVAHFGNQKHPTLKTITQNTGIDIAVKAGSPVSAVAEGEISKIWWLPGYGNIVIINHYGGYRTIYTHLAEIKIAEGQKVKEGDVIAESGEALNGPRLHFEIWKDREKQNPETWLGKQ